MVIGQYQTKFQNGYEYMSANPYILIIGLI